MIRKLFKWIFKDELESLERSKKECRELQDALSVHEQRIMNMLGNIDVSVDVHEYSHSWACISIQGEKSDYIKFVDLGRSDILDIQRFLRRFDRGKVDASPHASKFLRFV